MIYPFFLAALPSGGAASWRSQNGMIKKSTINQIVEAILAERDYYSPGSCESIANEAVIYYKTFMICEDRGIDAAMKYFTGTHDGDEYKRFKTERGIIGGVDE